MKIFDEEQLPLLRLVCQPGMKDRHWAQIKKSTRLESLEITDTSNLLQMLDVGLQHYAGVIEETCVAAGHEHALEEQLELMEHAWTAATFTAEPWLGFYKLSGTEEVQQVCAKSLLLYRCCLPHQTSNFWAVSLNKSPVFDKSTASYFTVRSSKRLWIQN